MRIAEFGKKLNSYLDNGQIVVDGAQTASSFKPYRIKNFARLYRTIQFINEQDWLSNFIEDDLRVLMGNFSITDSTISLSDRDYSTLMNAIGKINEKLQITMGLIEDFTSEQEEQVINIKLPPAIGSLKDLQEFNKRLESIFRLYNVTGEFKVVGFDRGSEWYEILIDVPNLYKYFVITLSIAYSLVKIRKEFYDSELAKANVALLKKHDIKLNEEELKDEMTEIQAQKAASDAVKKLGTTDNKTEGEMTAMVLKATTELVKELEKGTEFHLSLNPPEYISENHDGDYLKIDYSSIPPIEKQVKEQKHITADSDQTKDK